MLNPTRINRLLIALLLASGPGFAAPLSKAPAASEATIASDQLELLENGGKTVFTGHVLLERPPYVLKANQMTRYQNTGLVEAQGRIVGTWINEAGEKTEAQGEFGRYDPAAQTAELWTKPNAQILVTSQNAKGTSRFTSDRAKLDLAQKRVRMIDNVQGHIVPASQP
jgi:lipopolysaccharide export system protein LptA